MLHASLFGPRQSETLEDWPSALDDLDDDALLWVDAAAPTDDEVGRIADTLSMPVEWLHPGDRDGIAGVADDGERLLVTVYAAAGRPSPPWPRSSVSSGQTGS